MVPTADLDGHLGSQKSIGLSKLRSLASPAAFHEVEPLVRSKANDGLTGSGPRGQQRLVRSRGTSGIACSGWSGCIARPRVQSPSMVRTSSRSPRPCRIYPSSRPQASTGSGGSLGAGRCQRGRARSDPQLLVASGLALVLRRNSSDAPCPWLTRHEAVSPMYWHSAVFKRSWGSLVGARASSGTEFGHHVSGDSGFSFWAYAGGAR